MTNDPLRADKEHCAAESSDCVLCQAEGTELRLFSDGCLSWYCLSCDTESAGPMLLDISAKLRAIPTAERLWLWKNFVNGEPQYWAFDNAYPCHPNGDPITLGEPCGYAIVMGSIQGRDDVPDHQVLAAIKRAKNAAPQAPNANRPENAPEPAVAASVFQSAGADIKFTEHELAQLITSPFGWTYAPEALREKVRRLASSYAVPTVGARSSEHVCGLQGFNPMIDPPCPGCVTRSHGP